MDITAENLTPTRILEFYRKHNLKPREGCIKPTGGGCCGMGVVQLELGLVDKPGLTGQKLRQRLGTGFVQMFELGFDCAMRGEKILKHWEAQEEVQLGYDSAVLAKQELGWVEDK